MNNVGEDEDDDDDNEDDDSDVNELVISFSFLTAADRSPIT